MQEEDFHRQIVMELTLGRPLPSLWAKVISEAKGDKAYAKALYLRYRMDSLKALHTSSPDHPLLSNVTLKRNYHLYLLIGTTLVLSIFASCMVLL
ncbi:hypothetical protein JQR84_23870 (plasmid) [Pseudomonas luteola]|uniref:hypothetical protein n=1 Tax=Pseudomonas TaxID=286 RepID=UPI003DA17D89